MFSLQPNWGRGHGSEGAGVEGGGGRGQRGDTAQTMYTHMNKCISN
jgi:hypothetical protein